MGIEGEKVKVLEISGMSKSFRGKDVLHDISFHVDKNQILGLIGKSGAGKTTILKILIGYYFPDYGYIYFNGKDYSKEMGNIRSKIGFVTQDNCFYDELTITENLEYFGKIYNVPTNLIKKNSAELLKFLQLEESKDVVGKYLSGGMKRRLDFACAMIHNPEIIIMDEPTTGLDPILRKQIWNLIKQIKGLGKTIIFSSHLLTELDSLCDKVAIINDGTVAAFGDIKEVKDKFSSNYEVHLETRPGNYVKIVEEMQDDNITIRRYIVKDHKLVIFTSNPHDAVKMIIPILDKLGEEMIDLDVEKPSLNEVFEFYVEGEQ